MQSCIKKLDTHQQRVLVLGMAVPRKLHAHGPRTVDISRDGAFLASLQDISNLHKRGSDMTTNRRIVFASRDRAIFRVKAPLDGEFHPIRTEKLLSSLPCTEDDCLRQIDGHTSYTILLGGFFLHPHDSCVGWNLPKTFLISCTRNTSFGSTFTAWFARLRPPSIGRRPSHRMAPHHHSRAFF